MANPGNRPEEIKRKLISMPLSLFNELAETAKRNERNPEAEIRFAIRRHLETEKEAA
jgi:hypothetical protein